MPCCSCHCIASALLLFAHIFFFYFWSATMSWLLLLFVFFAMCACKCVFFFVVQIFFYFVFSFLFAFECMCPLRYDPRDFAWLILLKWDFEWKHLLNFYCVLNLLQQLTIVRCCIYVSVRGCTAILGNGQYIHLCLLFNDLCMCVFFRFCWIHQTSLQK